MFFRLWDFKASERGKEQITVFKNENARGWLIVTITVLFFTVHAGSRITALEFVNDLHVSLLLAASGMDFSCFPLRGASMLSHGVKRR